MPLKLDLRQDLIIHWPSATSAIAPLLEQLKARALLTDGPPLAVPGLAQIADISTPDAQAVRAAQKAGFDAAAVPAPADEAELKKLLEEFRDFIVIVYLTPEQVGWKTAPAHAVLRSGVWPGIVPTDTSKAGATEHVWLDADTSLYAQLRAQYPARRAVLGYRPDKDGGVPETRSVPARSVEVALADAYAAGGSVILSLPLDYRVALGKNDARALESWKTLAEVRAFVSERLAITDTPLAGRTAVICGTIEQTGEILNLAFRKNLCPVPLAKPEFTTARFDIVVAANIEVPPVMADNLARFAMAGGSVIAAPAGEEKSPWWTRRGWKKLRAEPDRDVYAAGRGMVYAYHDTVMDPGAFALDVKELAGQLSQPGIGVKNYDLRLWTADTVLGTLHRLSPTSIAVVLTAYGTPLRHEFLVSVRGAFKRARYETIGVPAKPVELMKRPGRVEFTLTQLSRIGILTLEE